MTGCLNCGHPWLAHEYAIGVTYVIRAASPDEAMDIAAGAFAGDDRFQHASGAYPVGADVDVESLAAPVVHDGHNRAGKRPEGIERLRDPETDAIVGMNEGLELREQTAASPSSEPARVEWEVVKRYDGPEEDVPFVTHIISRAMARVEARALNREPHEQGTVFVAREREVGPWRDVAPPPAHVEGSTHG